MRCCIAGKDLKSVFMDIAPLLKKYDRARVVGIETTKTSITFTVDIGTCYTRTLDIHSVTDGVDMSMTVMFTDLSSFISSREDVVVELTQYFILIKTRKASISLNMGESIVTPYTARGGKVAPLDFGELKRAVKVFSGTTDIQKVFSRDFAIIFYGAWALMKTPTVWVHTKCKGLHGVLYLEQLRSIVAFQPDVVEESDRLEFRKGNAILSVPRVTPVDTDKFFTYKDTLTYMSTFNGDSARKELLEVKKQIGITETLVHIYNVGFSIDISKSGISLHQEYNIQGNTVYSYKIMLDTLIMCLTILGEDTEIQVYGKEGIICLESQDTAILVSV